MPLSFEKVSFSWIPGPHFCHDGNKADVTIPELLRSAMKVLTAGMQMRRSSKEVIRHLILRSGLSGAYLAYRSARGQNVEHLRLRTLCERFSTIYRNRVWLNDRTNGSVSGRGSELENTKAIRLNLPKLLASLQTRILLDVGCGDFSWLREVVIDCRYIGVDVANEIVDLNVQKYASANRTFYTLDATKDPLPLADTALCREVLFHLSFDDVEALIRNIRTTGISTVIATNDFGTNFNSDIQSGDYRPLNLTKPPFRFPPPEWCIRDDEVSPGRVLALWRISRLREHL